MEFTLTDEEFSDLDAAAARAGLARGAYAAQAALATARGLASRDGAPAREALAELVRCAGLVRRVGVNLNQAVAKLNATGQRSGDLLPYAAESVRRARLLDDGGGGAAEEAAVIDKVLRGERPEGLIHYLYGPGRREEHTDPHIVAGWRDPAELEPPLRPGGQRDFRRLNGLLQQTLAALGDRAPNRPVWHCAIRAARGDRLLSDEEWAQVAAEIMDRTGLAPRGQEDDAVRWVAIRHAADHIHIVATLARQDGRRASVSNDYYRVREACLAVEDRFGLRRTAPADRTAASRPTRAETEKAQRRGQREAPRVDAQARGEHRGGRGDE